MTVIFNRHELHALPIEIGRAAVRPRRDSAVRLISPEAQKERGIEGNNRQRHLDQEIVAASEQLKVSRAASAEAKQELARVEERAAEYRQRAEAARLAHEQARDEARNAEMALRRQQRATADSRLELRRALEWVARLEAFDTL